MKKLSALALLAGTNLAQAHTGHGLPGVSHWHATDVALVLAALAVLGLWLARRK
ncbi:MAG: hypothetical protein QE285_09270 [Aquabacterium sp.]|nr:hypothetical protein [Aquabacterium sp.]